MGSKKQEEREIIKDLEESGAIKLADITADDLDQRGCENLMIYMTRQIAEDYKRDYRQYVYASSLVKSDEAFFKGDAFDAAFPGVDPEWFMNQLRGGAHPTLRKGKHPVFISQSAFDNARVMYAGLKTVDDDDDDDDKVEWKSPRTGVPSDRGNRYIAINKRILLASGIVLDQKNELANIPVKLSVVDVQDETGTHKGILITRKCDKKKDE